MFVALRFFSWCAPRACGAGAWWPRVFFFLVRAAGGRCCCLVAARVFFLGAFGGRRLRLLLRRVVVRRARLAVRRLLFGGGSNVCNKLLVGETPSGLEIKRPCSLNVFCFSRAGGATSGNFSFPDCCRSRAGGGRRGVWLLLWACGSARRAASGGRVAGRAVFSDVPGRPAGAPLAPFLMALKKAGSLFLKVL